MSAGDSKGGPPSTLQSYVDSAAGAVQAAIGNLTGNSEEQAKGEVRKQAGEAQYEASQASIKLPGATVSSSGGISRDDEKRTQGSWNQTVGSAKETIGGLVGSEVRRCPPNFDSCITHRADGGRVTVCSPSNHLDASRICRDRKKRPRVN